MGETVTMTSKELNRLKTLCKVQEGTLTQVLAAKQLNLSDRQVRRLLVSMREQGDKGLISKHRGKRSNRSIEMSVKYNALNIIKTYYSDFGPKLAKEYLFKNHKIKISQETLRSWMIEAHLWFPRKKQRKAHFLRERRKAFGELIQIDGSFHPWFEDRSDPCVLMVFIDDATSEITSLHFAKSESLEAYLTTLEKHLITYGIPLSFYGDKCAVLRSRMPMINSQTQFQKVLKELECDLILANSPQAKGRVERANRTLQDRLVKELRLRNISSIEEANEMLDAFRVEYNDFFSKRTNEQANAHRSLEGICLERVLSTREIRTLLKDSTVQFRNTFYIISAQDNNSHLSKGSEVEIRTLRGGTVEAYFKGREVNMTSLKEIDNPTLDSKQVQSLSNKDRYKRKVTHPYKRAYFRKKVAHDVLINVI